MSPWIVPGLCVIGLVHVVLGVALAAARWRRVGTIRHSGTEVL